MICKACVTAAETDDMKLHEECPGGSHCFCQHKSKADYPSPSHVSGNVDLSDTPTPGVRDVQHFS